MFPFRVMTVVGHSRETETNLSRDEANTKRNFKSTYLTGKPERSGKTMHTVFKKIH